MNEQLENDFLSKVETLKDKVNVLHFSTGADSVACYLRLREHGIDPILVYHYFLKDLPMVKNYLDYFSKKFSARIYQIPSTLWAEHIDNALYQKPIKAREKFRNNIASCGYEAYTKDACDAIIRDTLGGDVVFHLGLRYTDGIWRFQHLQQHGVIFKDKFYPVASFQIRDIQDILEKHDCFLPLEYKLWGISWEAPRAWNINLIKEHCPETYRRIAEIFPMARLEGVRKYARLNQHFKSRLTQFSRFAIPKEMYPVW
jgi:hypothetical protein